MSHVELDVDAGVCGFRTSARVTSDDSQHVVFDVETTCSKIGALADSIGQHGLIDAFQEIDARRESVVLSLATSHLTGCCAACAVPVGLFKAMQVAAGLALPKDITIALART